MTKQKVKKVLLGTDLFIDNNYLEQYIDLIFTEQEPNQYSEQHHVLPVSYYKHQYNVDRYAAEKLADTDVNNFTVKLTYMNHCKAH